MKNNVTPVVPNFPYAQSLKGVSFHRLVNVMIGQMYKQLTGVGFATFTTSIRFFFFLYSTRIDNIVAL